MIRSRPTYVLVGWAVVALAILSAPSPTAAGRAPAAGASSSSNFGTRHFKILLPDGTPVDLPENPASLTEKQLAGFGIAPGRHGIGVAHATLMPPHARLSRQAPTRVITNSAVNKCNGNVCEDVYGSGRYVNAWDTHITIGFVGCTYAAFWEPSNVIIALSNTVCSDVPSEPWAYMVNGLPHEFANFSTACATWVGVTGKPCALIYQF